MDTDSNKITWVVIIVAAVAIMGGLFVKFVPNIDSQMQGYAQTVIGKFRGGTIDDSSNSDFSYSDPNTDDHTISIEGFSHKGYVGHNENLIIPEYRKIGSVYYKVTAISNDAFNGNTSIKQVTIPDGVRIIGIGAFQHNSNLKYVILGSDVTSIGKWAFQYTPLTSVEFPASLTSIDGWAFQHTALTRVDFPASVKSVGDWAFDDTPISAISFRNRVDLGHGSFRQTNLTNVTLPTGSTYQTSLPTWNYTFETNVNVTIK